MVRGRMLQELGKGSNIIHISGDSDISLPLSPVLADGRMDGQAKNKPGLPAEMSPKSTETNKAGWCGTQVWLH